MLLARFTSRLGSRLTACDSVARDIPEDAWHARLIERKQPGHVVDLRLRGGSGRLGAYGAQAVSNLGPQRTDADHATDVLSVVSPDEYLAILEVTAVTE